VLNPSGVRFGSGEIYSVLERSEFASRIDDAICVGQRRPQDEDERVLLFIKMRPNQKLDRSFEQAIRTAIRAVLSPRHVPAHILEVKEIPVSHDINLQPLARMRAYVGKEGAARLMVHPCSTRSTVRRSRSQSRRSYPGCALCRALRSLIQRP
jgi:hypothetical protein